MVEVFCRICLLICTQNSFSINYLTINLIKVIMSGLILPTLSLFKITELGDQMQFKDKSSKGCEDTGVLSRKGTQDISR